MNLLKLLKKTLSAADVSGLASQSRRGVLETLEPRTVLSGFGMQPMMDHHEGGRHFEGPPGGHEERFLGPEFGGPQFGARDFGMPRLPPPPGDFGRPGGEDHDFGLLRPPRPAILPAPTESGGTQPQVPVSVSRVELPPAVASFAAAGLSSLSEVVSKMLPAAQSESQAITETERFKIRLDGVDSDGIDRDEQPEIETTAVKPVRNEPDGLIELFTEKTPQRLKRKTIRDGEIRPEQEDRPERLLTQLEGALEAAPVLRQPEKARDAILATWPVSHSVSSPDDEGLIELVAGSEVFASQSAPRGEVLEASSLRYSSATPLEAEVGVCQVLELAPEPVTAAKTSASTPE